MKILRYALIAVAALLVLAIGGAVVFLLTFDPNRYKAQIEQTVKERTGRTLRLQGDLKVAIFPSLGADVSRVSLTERGSEQEFVSLDTAHASVALLPLLHGDVVVDKIKVSGLKANVVKDKSGKFNFDDLLEGKGAKPEAGAPQPKKEGPKGGGGEGNVKFDIAGVAIERSAVSYKDLASGRQLALSELKLSTGRVAERADGKLEFSASAKGTEPALDLKAQLAGLYGADLGAKTFSLSKLDGSVKGTLDGHALNATLAGSVQVNLDKETLDAELMSKFDESNIQAKLGLAKFSPPAYRFDITVDKLNLDQYFPPKSTPAPAAPAPAGKSEPGKEEDAPVDFSAIKDLDASGKLQFGALQVKGLKLANLKADVKAANGRLDVSPHSANLYEGTLAGALSLQAGGSRVLLKESLANVQVGPLLRDVAQQDRLEGRGNVALDVSGAGGTVNAIKKSLDGSAKVNLRDGAIKGVNIGELLRKVKSLGKSQEGSADSKERTDFAELNATFAIKNGVAHNQDLDVKSPLLRVGGAGDIDVGNSTINYVVKASVVATAKGQGGAGLDQLAGLTVPVKLSGPFDGLKYQVDYGAAAADLAKSKVGAKVKEGIDKNKGKVEEQVRDRLKGLLGR
jgi:AsmA protein